jgi:hypothetical protein
MVSEKKKRYHRAYIRKHYLEHKDYYKLKSEERRERLKNDPAFIQQRKDARKRWEKKNHGKFLTYKRLWARAHSKSKNSESKIGKNKPTREHQWLCKIHNLWIGEMHNCPDCTLPPPTPF